MPLRIAVLTTITISIAAGHVSAANSRIDSALAGIGDTIAHRTRVFVRLVGAGPSVRDNVIRGENLVRGDRLDESVICGGSIHRE